MYFCREQFKLKRNIVQRKQVNRQMVGRPGEANGMGLDSASIGTMELAPQE